jgi:hypothetical protein
MFSGVSEPVHGGGACRLEVLPGKSWFGNESLFGEPPGEAVTVDGRVRWRGGAQAVVTDDADGDRGEEREREDEADSGGDAWRGHDEDVSGCWGKLKLGGGVGFGSTRRG